ncbi:MAG: hypothetical protein ACO3QM_06615 [Candidatus Nanopelagicaceae bacterium]
MGLDMYLKAKAYVGGYDFLPDHDRESFSKIVEAVGGHDLIDTDSPSAEVALTAGYWRKANAIHGWFVKNVQDGEDECKEHYVSREQLLELQEACVEVISNPDRASELLPVTQGFFFGTYEYDEWYFSYVRETIDMIGRLLKTAGESWEFYYRSSW